MANTNAIPINLDGELAEGIMNIIDQKGYGHSTFLVKDFMEKYREQLIAFWNGQGKNGLEIWERWFKKWSMTKAEQESIKAQKERDKHDKLVKQYMALAMEQPLAEELATQFPESDPFEVIKHRSYNIQNKPIETKQTQKEAEEAEKLEASHKAYEEKIRTMTETMKANRESEPTQPQQA